MIDFAVSIQEIEKEFELLKTNLLCLFNVMKMNMIATTFEKSTQGRFQCPIVCPIDILFGLRNCVIVIFAHFSR